MTTVILAGALLASYALGCLVDWLVMRHKVRRAEDAAAEAYRVGYQDGVRAFDQTGEKR